MEEKKLTSLVEIATDEKLKESDINVNEQISQLINSRASLPKLGL